MSSAVLPVLYANSSSIDDSGPGLAEIEFDVLLTSRASTPVTLKYETEDGTFDGEDFPGTAYANQDYTPASGTLTIPAGQTSGVVSVAIIPNPARTTNRVFVLAFSSPVGAQLATPKISGTIVHI